MSYKAFRQLVSTRDTGTVVEKSTHNCIVRVEWWRRGSETSTHAWLTSNNNKQVRSAAQHVRQSLVIKGEITGNLRSARPASFNELTDERGGIITGTGRSVYSIVRGLIISEHLRRRGTRLNYDYPCPRPRNNRDGSKSSSSIHHSMFEPVTRSSES